MMGSGPGPVTVRGSAPLRAGVGRCLSVGVAVVPPGGIVARSDAGFGDESRSVARGGARRGLRGPGRRPPPSPRRACALASRLGPDPAARGSDPLAGPRAVRAPFVEGRGAHAATPRAFGAPG